MVIIGISDCHEAPQASSARRWEPPEGVGLSRASRVAVGAAAPQQLASPA